MEKEVFFYFKVLIQNLHNIGFDRDDIVTFLLKCKGGDLEKESLSMLYDTIDLILPPA